MIEKIKDLMKAHLPSSEAHGHCDGPCGVYDPASARIAAEAVVSMTKKILALEVPGDQNSQKWATYVNTLSRYIQIKEQQAHETKEHLLVLWTDFFKAEHLEKFPKLHDTFWMATKACSACKVEVNLDKANDLLGKVKEIHNMFWSAKGKEVPWVTAS